MKILITLLILVAINLQAVDHYFYYDGAGNREERTQIKRLKVVAQPKDEVLGEHKITVYPNPTYGPLKIDITNLTEEITAEIEVLSLSGEMLFEFKDIVGITNIDMSKQVNGVYLINIRIGEKTSYWKIVKNN